MIVTQLGYYEQVPSSHFAGLDGLMYPLPNGFFISIHFSIINVLQSMFCLRGCWIEGSQFEWKQAPSRLS